MRPQILHNPSELATLLDMNGGGLVVLAETDEWLAFDTAKWLETPGNIALRIGNDLSLFDYVQPSVYEGHVFFSSRGAQALETAKVMLEWMLTRGGAKTILGATPASAKAAWLFCRMLGFRKTGEGERDGVNMLFSELQSGNPPAPISVA